ncbi:MAG: hypothetical protein Q9164_006124 [Protoblastenia rupestris]
MLRNYGRRSREQGTTSPSRLSSLVSRSPRTRHQHTADSSFPNLPYLRSTQHPNRTSGFTSLQDLTKTTRQVLSTPGTHKTPPGIVTGRLQHDELLRRASPIPASESDKPTELTLWHSNFSSFESFSHDQSALSEQSSQPTTPSPARPLAHFLSQEANSFADTNMGQKVSGIKRKPVQSPDQQNLDAFSTSPPRSPDTSPEKSATGREPLPVLDQRASSVQLPIPRRRSSLTALHLDSSHFESPISHHDELNHRASTLTSSSRPMSRSPSTITPSGPTQRQRGDTLSPPLLSTLSPRGLSPSSEQLRTPPPSSPTPAQIHLPETFPNGPIPTPRPPLTKVHYECYMLHRRMPRSSNKVCPVPCMACGTAEGENYWKCVWCCLRICGGCMVEFSGKGRKLDVLLKLLEKKEEGGAEEGKLIVENETAGKGMGKENMGVKGVGVVVTEILGKKAAANILRDSRG